MLNSIILHSNTMMWIQQVILLGSIDASLRTEAQLEGSQLRYCSNKEAFVGTCTSLGLTKLEVGFH